MSTTTDHLVDSVDSVSLAGVGASTEGADVKTMPMSQNGLSSELLEELAALRGRESPRRRAAADGRGLSAA